MTRGETKTYRPWEFEWQADGVSTGGVVGRVVGRGKIERIVAEDGCRKIAISARSRQVDAGLVVLEADPKLRAARFTAPAACVGRRRRRFESVAAMTFGVAAQLVLEAVKAQFKHARRPAHFNHRDGKNGEHNENQWRCHGDSVQGRSEVKTVERSRTHTHTQPCERVDFCITGGLKCVDKLSLEIIHHHHGLKSFWRKWNLVINWQRPWERKLVKWVREKRQCTSTWCRGWRRTDDTQGPSVRTVVYRRCSMPPPGRRCPLARWRKSSKALPSTAQQQQREKNRKGKKNTSRRRRKWLKQNRKLRWVPPLLQVFWSFSSTPPYRRCRHADVKQHNEY